MPPFPLEIQLNILESHLESSSRLFSKRRYQSLCTLSLVNRQWLAWAQVRLFRHVHLPTVKQANLFQTTLLLENRSGPGSRRSGLSAVVRVIRFGEVFTPCMRVATAEQMGIQKILEACGFVEEVYVSSITKLVLQEDLAPVASTLVSFKMYNGTVSPSTLPSPPRIHFPVLKNFHAHRVALPLDTVGRFCTPRTTPSLRNVSIHSLAYVFNLLPFVLNTEMLGILPQLNCVSGLEIFGQSWRGRGDDDEIEEEVEWGEQDEDHARAEAEVAKKMRSTVNYTFLNCRASDLDARSVSYLPDSIRVLRLTDRPPLLQPLRPDRQFRLINLLREQLRSGSLKNLSELRVPASWEKGSEGEALKELGRAQGVAVSFSPVGDEVGMEELAFGSEFWEMVARLEREEEREKHKRTV